jgi:hypothetical protein
MHNLSFDENTRQGIVNEREILFNEYSTIKKKNFNPFALGLAFSPIFIIIFAWFSGKLFGDNVTLGVLFAFSPIIICGIGRFWLNLRKINKIEYLEKTIAELDNEGYNLVSQSLCKYFNISSSRLTDELRLMLQSYPTVVRKMGTNYYYWIDIGCINEVYNILSRKFKQESYTDSTMDLNLENLKLQNESIDIDNKQKRFWRCDYCNNMNRAEEMKCLGCGAARPNPS